MLIAKTCNTSHIVAVIWMHMTILSLKLNYLSQYLKSDEININVDTLQKSSDKFPLIMSATMENCQNQHFIVSGISNCREKVLRSIKELSLSFPFL